MFMRAPLFLVCLCLVIGSPAGFGRAHDDLAVQTARLDAQIAEAPLEWALYLRRGYLLGLHGERRGALDDLGRAQALAPQSPRIYALRGELRLAWGEPREALVEVKQWLAREPRAGRALLLASRCLFLLGEAHGAAQSMDRGLALLAHPSPDDFLERAELHVQLGDIARAVAGLDAGLVRLGGSIALERHALQLEIRAARYEAALARLDGLCTNSGGNLSYALRRAEVLEYMGDLSAAKTAFGAAASKAGDLPPAKRATRAHQQLATRIRAGLKRCAPESKHLSHPVSHP
jgi:tetratricopeptide (TPR) repeat protein